jgi:hypothetical protein
MVKRKHPNIQNRSGRDRRRLFDAYYIAEDGTKKSILKERRSKAERRKGWKRVSEWGSVCEEKNPKAAK